MGDQGESMAASRAYIGGLTPALPVANADDLETGDGLR
jgi:hypothetical protein